MKNVITYYYGFFVDSITYQNSKYYIVSNNQKYILEELPSSTLYINDLIVKQLKKYSYFHDIIKNINNDYITVINKKKYILLKQANYTDYKICLNDIKIDYYLDNGIGNYRSNYWYKLWENKIDLFEKVLYSKKQQYSDTIAIFHYFIGMGENAVFYIKKTFSSVKEINIRLVASHKRLNINTTLYDYYDPSDIIIDYPSRDIAEYVKSMIIENIFDIDEFEKYLSKINLSTFELKLLFGRLMFPTFFFDYMENVTKINKNILEKYVIRYEKELYNINKLLSNKYNIEKVNWLFQNKTEYY